MRINPEFSVIRKLNSLVQKHKAEGSVPIDEIQEITSDLEDFIRQEANYSKLYIVTAADYIEIETEIKK